MLQLNRFLMREYESFHVSKHVVAEYSNSQYSKVHGANMGPTRVLLAPDGPHVGPMNLTCDAIEREVVLVA